MAYEKIHESIDFKDRQAPSITADVLNRREATFEELDNRTVELSIFNESVPETYATKEEVTESIAELETEVAETYATKSEVEEVSETVTEIATEVSKGKADVILANASGESIHATDTTNNKAVEFSLLGKATQKQYSGKNLLKPYLRNVAKNGIDFTVNASGSVEINGTNTSDIWTNIGEDMSDLPNGEYTFSMNTANFSSAWIALQMSDGTIKYLSLASEVGQGYTFEVTDDLKLSLVAFSINTGNTFDNLTFYPMIRLSTVEDATWEPYVGGIPSPNPDYPQEIEVSGASGSVEVKSLGKNFLPNIAISKTSNGGTFTVNEDKSITIDGTFTATSYCNIDYVSGGLTSVNDISNITGKTLLMSISDVEKTGISMYADYFEEDNLTYFGVRSTLTKTEIVYPSEASKGRTYLQVSAGTYNNVTVYPMISIEGGEYEPYKESTTIISTPNGLPGIPVSSGGNYVDENGQHWICDEKRKYADGTGQYIQRVKDFVFDETLSFVKNGTIFYCDFAMDRSRSIKVAMCTNHKNILDNRIANIATAENYLQNGEFALRNTGENNFYTVYFKNNSIETASDFKTMMLGEKMYYILAEPIITDLTAEEVAELEAVQTFYPTTNILNDAGCGMEVTYKADTKLYIDGKIAELAHALLETMT